MSFRLRCCSLSPHSWGLHAITKKMHRFGTLKRIYNTCDSEPPTLYLHYHAVLYNSQCLLLDSECAAVPSTPWLTFSSFLCDCSRTGRLPCVRNHLKLPLSVSNCVRLSWSFAIVVIFCTAPQVMRRAPSSLDCHVGKSNSLFHI